MSTHGGRGRKGKVITPLSKVPLVTKKQTSGEHLSSGKAPKSSGEL